VNILKGNLSDEVWERDIPLAIRQIFKLCVSLGGTLSGEHGIGWVQKGFMDIAFSERMIDLQKEIKKVFDPKGILNPGKLFE
jgi:glycolate oxidase